MFPSTFLANCISKYHQVFTYLSHVCPFNVVPHCPLSWFFGAMCKNSIDSHCISSKPFNLISKDIYWFCYLFILLLTSRIIRVLHLRAVSRQTCGPGNLLSDWSWHVNCLLVGTVCYNQICYFIVNPLKIFIT